jgi:hypothetical protein
MDGIVGLVDAVADVVWVTGTPIAGIKLVQCAGGEDAY